MSSHKLGGKSAPVSAIFSQELIEAVSFQNVYGLPGFVTTDHRLVENQFFLGE